MRILLVEDNAADAWLMGKLMAEAEAMPLQVETVPRLEAALDHLRGAPTDLVLLDLTLPDSKGLETYVRLAAAAPDVPVVVVTGVGDSEVTLEAVRKGAQDYLVKGRFSGPQLAQALRYAVERHRLQRQVVELSLTDELTGLHNLRGFRHLADEDFHTAKRRHMGCYLVFVDLDGLKAINDRHGHGAGDEAIRGGAEVLREAFRSTDLVARVGGDEFVVLARDAMPETEETLRAHLDGALARWNLRHQKAWRLELSAGFLRRPAGSDLTLEAALAQADALMYQRKRARRAKTASD
jgi:diguanylate cyclase (GGDEF)-like protein